MKCKQAPNERKLAENWEICDYLHISGISCFTCVWEEWPFKGDSTKKKQVFQQSNFPIQPKTKHQ